MEINGLPLHPLVVHAAVVFGPAALTALAYVVLPAWRDRLRWPMVVLALIGTGAIAAAYFTGMNFFNSRPPELQQLEILQTHRTRAIRLFWVTLGFGVLAVLAAWLHAAPAPCAWC